MVKVISAIATSLFALAACFFIAGNLDPFSWDAGGRAITVFIFVAVFGLTVTCPYFEE